METQVVSGSQVIIRLKRKRQEKPLDALLVEAHDDEHYESIRKKRAMIDDIACAFSKLNHDAGACEATPSNEIEKSSDNKVSGEKSSGKVRFVFKRLETINMSPEDAMANASLLRNNKRTLESDNNKKGPNSNDSDIGDNTFREVRRFKAINMEGESKRSRRDIARFHVIDLANTSVNANMNPASSNHSVLPHLSNKTSITSPDKDKEMVNSTTSINNSAFAGDIVCNGVPLAKKKTIILSPIDRRMDEAIFDAFKTGNCQATLSAISMGADVNFQRKNSDYTTALMAAAFHGDMSVVSRLLTSGANPMLKDVHGKDAIDLAMDKGYSDISILMRATSDEARQKEHPEDFVYDVYVKDIKFTGTSSENRDQHSLDNSSTNKSPIEGSTLEGINSSLSLSDEVLRSMPLIHLSGININQGNDSEEMELVFEHESDWSECDDDVDVDSNAEDYEGNDYPDEESSNESDMDSHDEYLAYARMAKPQGVDFDEYYGSGDDIEGYKDDEEYDMYEVEISDDDY